MGFFCFRQVMQIRQLYDLYLQHPVVFTDSRNTPGNGIFFSLKGEKFNGNRFAGEAIRNGAAFAVVDQAEYVRDKRFILVRDAAATLRELSRYHRCKLGIPIIAITGSNGKTTTKNLLATILSAKFRTACTRGNLNNHIGVPLTLLSFTGEHELGIVEMGANHPGEIETLCEIAEPGYGLVTNIGKAHLEGFGSLEGVKRTKGELYRYLEKRNGLVFVNGSDPVLTGMLSRLNVKSVRYGSPEGTLCRTRIISSTPFLNIHVALYGKQPADFELKTRLVGKYNLENLQAAICIAHHFEVPAQKIKTALNDYTPEALRSQLIITPKNQVFMDAYNANPTSMVASLTDFAMDHRENTAVILGDMLELGENSEQEHQKILALLETFNIGTVVLAGEIFHRLSKPDRFHSFPDVDALIRWLKKYPLTGNYVLLKGSRKIELERAMSCL